jgi:hypothetical protein
MKTTYKLTKNEVTNLFDFLEENIIKSDVILTFISNSVGTIIEITDVTTGKTKNLTDYDSW